VSLHHYATDDVMCLPHSVTLSQMMSKLASEQGDTTGGDTSASASECASGAMTVLNLLHEIFCTRKLSDERVVGWKLLLHEVGVTVCVCVCVYGGGVVILTWIRYVRTHSLTLSLSHSLTLSLSHSLTHSLTVILCVHCRWPLAASLFRPSASSHYCAYSFTGSDYTSCRVR
jgi:hypothetical protein